MLLVPYRNHIAFSIVCVCMCMCMSMYEYVYTPEYDKDRYKRNYGSWDIVKCENEAT